MLRAFIRALAIALPTLASSCTQKPDIRVFAYPEQVALSEICARPDAGSIRRLTILETPAFTYIQTFSDPCNKAPSGLSLQGEKKAAAPKSDKPLIIWASQYGDADSDKNIIWSDKVADTLRAQGYTVVDAHNKTGDDLKTLVAEANKNNESGRAIIVTSGHGSVEPTINPDGTTTDTHNITRTDPDGEQATVQTNRDILQPALAGLGLPPEKVVSVVSSCQSGQCVQDYGTTTPNGAIVTSSQTNQLSFSPNDNPELMIGRLAEVTDPKSNAFKQADADHDGTVTTHEFTNFANGNGEVDKQMAVTHVATVVYATPDGKPGDLGTQNVVYTQNPAVGGPDTPLVTGGTPGAVGQPGTEPENFTVGKAQADAEKTGDPTVYFGNSAEVYDTYKASQEFANGQIKAQEILGNYGNDPLRAGEELQGYGFSQDQIDSAVYANDRIATYDRVVANYGGDPLRAAEELNGLGYQTNDGDLPPIYVPGAANYGDNGAGDWGLGGTGASADQSSPKETSYNPDYTPPDSGSNTPDAGSDYGSYELTTKNMFVPRFVHPRRMDMTQMTMAFH